MAVKQFVLNSIRKLFTIKPLEKWLFKKLDDNPGSVFSKVIPDDKFYKQNSFRLANKRGINYELDLSNIVDNYLYFGIEDLGYQKVISDLIKADNIIDIGANIGSTSLFFASINKKAQIFSFEPHPKTFKRAQKNISLNSFNNIKLINKGLGERIDKVKLFEINEKNPGMNRISTRKLEQPYTEIDIDTLDNYVKSAGIDKADFIKIDVEGYEHQVLKGAVNTLKKTKPVLYIELDDDNLREHGDSAQKIISYLYTLGYLNIVNSETSVKISATDNFDHCHIDIIVYP